MPHSLRFFFSIQSQEKLGKVYGPVPPSFWVWLIFGSRITLRLHKIHKILHVTFAWYLQAFVKFVLLSNASPSRQVQPNSMNFLKFPLIAMFWNMIFYMCHPQMLGLVHPFYLLLLTNSQVCGYGPLSHQFDGTIRPLRWIISMLIASQIFRALLGCVNPPTIALLAPSGPS